MPQPAPGVSPRARTARGRSAVAPDRAIGASLRIAVLASGHGSNLQALIDAIDDGVLGAAIVLVAGDKADARALRRAETAGIATLALDPKTYRDRAAFDVDLFDRVAASDADLVVLAGFMRIIDAAVVRRWQGRVINIHPSLLPKHRGLDTHRRALAAGDAEHGASVHFVSAELDGGPCIAQARVPVLAGDDATTLAARVLAREHALLVAGVAAIASGDVTLDDRQRLRYRGALLATPAQLDDGDMLRFPK